MQIVTEIAKTLTVNTSAEGCWNNMHGADNLIDKAHHNYSF